MVCIENNTKLITYTHVIKFDDVETGKIDTTEKNGRKQNSCRGTRANPFSIILPQVSSAF